MLGRGDLFIGGVRRQSTELYRAYDPTAGAEIDESAAEAAFLPYSFVGLEQRAGFQEAIADQIEALGDTLVDRLHGRQSARRARAA